MPRLKHISREEDPDEFKEKVTFNAHAVENHGIDLPADATPEQVREALRLLLALLSRRDE